MKPRLYEKGEMHFSDNGICTLYEASFCEVTEELNGDFELKMRYPMKGEGLRELKTGRIIYAKPNMFELPEPFQIYAISKPIEGAVTVYAEHISYMTKKIVVSPFSAPDIAGAVRMLQENAVNPNPFTVTTEMSALNDINVNVPITMRHGVVGRIIPLYGGEVKCRRFEICILEKRGEDRGFSIRYGKNLIDLDQSEYASDMYDGVYPYYNFDGDEGKEYVELPEKYILIGSDNERIKPLNLTDRFSGKPSAEELRVKALEYLSKNDINAGFINIDVVFAMLSQTEEYQELIPLERIMLGDSVSLNVAQRGIIVKSRCVKTVYDVMRDKYTKITIGDRKRDLADSVADNRERLFYSETKIGEQGKSIARLNLRTSKTEAEVSAIAEWIGDEDGGMTKTIATLQATANANTAEIALHTQKITENSDSIASIRSVSDEHTSLIQNLTQTSAENTSAIAQTKQYANDLNATVASVTAWMGDETEGAKKTLSEVYQTSNSNTAAISYITTWKSGIDSSIARLEQETGANGAKIGLVVKSGTDGNYVDGSVLVEAINGQSSATIRADKIILDGYAKFTDVVEIAESVTAKTVNSNSADGNMTVSIRLGQLTLSQDYNGRSFSAEMNAAFFQAYHPIAGAYFVCGNANASEAAQVGFSTSHRIQFTSRNAQLIGTWLGTSSAAVTSDAGKKHDIADLDDRYSVFFDMVRPVAYKYNDGTSGRYHTGFIANEVEAALAEAGISTQEFAGFVNTEIVREDGETEVVRCLRYEEFIAILWREMQGIKAILLDRQTAG